MTRCPVKKPKKSKNPKPAPIPKPFGPLVDALSAKAGGEVPLAYKLGVTQYALRQWRVRGVPEAHWLKAAEVCGVTVDAIWRASEGRGTL